MTTQARPGCGFGDCALDADVLARIHYPSFVWAQFRCTHHARMERNHAASLRAEYEALPVASVDLSAWDVCGPCDRVRDECTCDGCEQCPQPDGAPLEQWQVTTPEAVWS